MLQSLLLIGCIVFFIFLVYSFHMRGRIHKDNLKNCSIYYLPMEENLLSKHDIKRSNKEISKRIDNYETKYKNKNNYKTFKDMKNKKNL